jgi:hypothetical protein
MEDDMFGQEQQARLLRALGEARREVIAARRVSRPRSGIVRCLESLTEEIDAVAQVITGRDDYFHSQQVGRRTPPAEEG